MFVRVRWKWLIWMAVLAIWSSSAEAHVKWFSDFSFLDQPLSLREIAVPTVFGLLILSMIVLGGLVAADRYIGQWNIYQRSNDWLAARSSYSRLLMRVAMGATLLLSWQADSMLAPELAVTATWVGWLQFGLALLLVSENTTPAAGVGVLALFVLALAEYGFFHMVDYAHYIGIAYYLIVSSHQNQAVRDSALPVLFATVGFALGWLGMEKLVYPEWALYLLAQNPQLTLGLPPEFFLRGAAFVELNLGYLLIIGLLERPLSLIITLVFFTTTTIFGKLEVIGHTPVHAALLVFLLNGPGTTFKPPILLHKKLNWRIAFAAVNFVLFVIVMGGAYSVSAQRQYASAVATLASNTVTVDLSGGAIPTVTTLDVIGEPDGGYTLFAEIENWRFTPERVGTPTVPNEGHGIVFLNGEQIGRLYAPYFFIGKLPAGTHTIEVRLTGNDHAQFVVGEEMVAAEITVTIE